MAEPQGPMKWWGWGRPEEQAELPPAALERLCEELGAPAGQRRPVPLDEVRLGEAALGRRAREALTNAVGAEWVRDDRLTRITHAAGKGYPDLVRLRAGDAERAPDAVVYPATEGEVKSVLDACASRGVAVVPFGGGTSVVGGVEPVRGPHSAVISLDLTRMTALEALDERSLTATFGPGLRGPKVEDLLGRSGLTLGHFPQSFEYSTVGGWVATRSAGQASTGYGNIEKLVCGLRCITPAGTIELSPVPATAAGPGLREFLVGSEGALGVITQATLKVRRRPAERAYEGWMFHTFEEGVEAFRELEQQGEAIPEVARLLDHEETRISTDLGTSDSPKRSAGLGYVRLRGYSGGCLAVLGFEGEHSGARRRRALAARLLRNAGGLPLGSSPGRAWARARYTGPHVRDALLDRGILVETLETAHEWSGLLGLHRAVREATAGALAGRGTPALVMCHVSHLYPNGASLYFTFLARQESGAELEQWRAAKEAATEAIVQHGGTLTHHHAIGRDHARWLPREISPVGVELLRSVKQRLDPAGVMNPGKLFPDDAPR